MPLHKWQIRRRARSSTSSSSGPSACPARRLDALQLRKLQRLVQHAYVHVPYYRDAIGEAGVHPEDIRSLEDIARLPLLSKDDVRQAPLLRPLRRQPSQARDAEDRDERLDRRAVRDVRRPLPARDALRDDAARARVDRLAVRRPPGSSLAPDARHDRRHRSFASGSTRGSCAVCSCRRSSCRRRSLEQYVAKIRKHRPVLLDGYAESLNFLATYLRSDGGDGLASRPRPMMSSAQTLPDERARADRASLGRAGLRQVRQPRVLGHRVSVRSRSTRPSRHGRELRRRVARGRVGRRGRGDRRGGRSPT